MASVILFLLQLRSSALIWFMMQGKYLPVFASEVYERDKDSSGVPINM